MAEGSDFLTPLMNIVGPLLLLAFIAYFVWKGGPSWRTRQRQGEATNRLYQEEEASRGDGEQRRDAKP
jgi:hypothetical protein